MRDYRIRRVLAVLASIAAFNTTAHAQRPRPSPSDDVSGLPLHIVPPGSGIPTAVAILLSGDGGWADIDKRVARRFAAQSVGVVGLDSRAYFMTGRTPDEIAADVARMIRHYTAQWSTTHVVLVGYARGANVAPFAANRLPADLKAMLSLVALLGPAERASFRFHWLDLLRDTSNPSDSPILPELERLRGTTVLCVFGRDEKESLCRLADPSAVHLDLRPGRHHFDGNYEAIAAEIVRIAAIHDASARR
jgi:type IV secretory pathway VirJ component